MSQETHHFRSIEKVSDSNLKRLSNYKIYFGHQSVGYNIIDGIKDIMEEHDKIQLNIVETSNAKDLTSPIFAHSRVGKNTQPISKIDAFSQFIEGGIGNKLDIAFLKLCYIDVHGHTDVEKLFGHYKRSMASLKEKYPKTTFIHVTMPLVARDKGVKALAKKILGRQLWGYSDNIRRNEFNELMQNEYAEKEPIFDLALIESTRLDGTREVYKDKDIMFYSLVSNYTSDGGHLNERGRKLVAEQLLIFLSGLRE